MEALCLCDHEQPLPSGDRDAGAKSSGWDVPRLEPTRPDAKQTGPMAAEHVCDAL